MGFFTFPISKKKKGLSTAQLRMELKPRIL